MDPTLRRLLLGGAAILALVAAFLGGILFERGRGAGPGPVATPAPTTIGPPGPTTIAPQPPTTAPVGTASPPGPPVMAAGAILQVGDQPVLAAAESAPCQALFTPGRIGLCGFADMAGGRVAWVVEHAPAVQGTAYTARIFTFVAAAGGWVERLVADDPTGEAFSDVKVAQADLTGDGPSELVVGFHRLGSGAILAYDLVTYAAGDVPRVAAHPDEPILGSVTVAPGAVEEYGARYPNNEPTCCPPFFLHRSIRFVDGFFRVAAEEPVGTQEVPPSGV